MVTPSDALSFGGYRGMRAFQYTCPEKFRTTSQEAEMGQNFSGEL